jgi:hypothetical protein
MTTTYELTATPAEYGFDCIIYKSIEAGVCGPASEISNFLTLEDAEAYYEHFGFRRVGAWTGRGGSIKAEVVA